MAHYRGRRIWTAESIAVLSALRDGFIAQYTPDGETHTVADLVADLASLSGQLAATSAERCHRDRGS